MVFNSRVVPVFILWLPKISGSSIYYNIVKFHLLFPAFISFLHAGSRNIIPRDGIQSRDFIQLIQVNCYIWAAFSISYRFQINYYYFQLKVFNCTDLIYAIRPIRQEYQKDWKGSCRIKTEY